MKKIKISITGLGYVGLQVALAFSKNQNLYNWIRICRASGSFSFFKKILYRWI